MPFIANGNAPLTQHLLLRKRSELQIAGGSRDADYIQSSDTVTVFVKPINTGIRQPVWCYTNHINLGAHYYSLYIDTDQTVVLRVKDAATAQSATTTNTVTLNQWSLITVDLTAFTVTLDNDVVNQGTGTAMPTVVNPRYLYAAVGHTASHEFGGEYAECKIAGLTVWRDFTWLAAHNTELYNGGSFINPFDHSQATTNQLPHLWHFFDDKKNHRGIYEMALGGSAIDVTETDHPYTVYPTPVTTPEAHGAVGDGVTDDTTAWNAAMASINTNGGTLDCTADATYLVSGTMTLLTTNNAVIRGRMATLKMANGTAHVSGRHQAGLASGAKFNIIRDLIVDGNKQNRTPSELFAYTFIVMNCEDNIVRGCTMKNGMTDSLYLTPQNEADIATFPDRNFFGDVTATFGWRNSASIINGFFNKFWFCEFSSAAGANPEAGMDMEPTPISLDGCEDTEYYWSRFTNNNRMGLQIDGVQSPIRRTIVRFCELDNNSQAGGSPLRGGAIFHNDILGVVEDNYIHDHAAAGEDLDTNGLCSMRFFSDRITYRRNRFERKTFAEPPAHVRVTTNSQGGHLFEDNEFYEYTVATTNPIHSPNAALITETGTTDQQATAGPGDNRPQLPTIPAIIALEGPQEPSGIGFPRIPFITAGLADYVITATGLAQIKIPEVSVAAAPETGFSASLYSTPSEPVGNTIINYSACASGTVTWATIASDIAVAVGSGHQTNITFPANQSLSDLSSTTFDLRNGKKLFLDMNGSVFVPRAGLSPAIRFTNVPSSLGHTISALTTSANKTIAIMQSVPSWATTNRWAKVFSWTQVYEGARSTGRVNGEALLIETISGNAVKFTEKIFSQTSQWTNANLRLLDYPSISTQVYLKNWKWNNLGTQQNDTILQFEHLTRPVWVNGEIENSATTDAQFNVAIRIDDCVRCYLQDVQARDFLTTNNNFYRMQWSAASKWCVEVFKDQSKNNKGWRHWIDSRAGGGTFTFTNTANAIVAGFPRLCHARSITGSTPGASPYTLHSGLEFVYDKCSVKNNIGLWSHARDRGHKYIDISFTGFVEIYDEAQDRRETGTAIIANGYLDFIRCTIPSGQFGQFPHWAQNFFDPASATVMYQDFSCVDCVWSASDVQTVVALASPHTLTDVVGVYSFVQDATSATAGIKVKTNTPRVMFAVGDSASVTGVGFYMDLSGASSGTIVGFNIASGNQVGGTWNVINSSGVTFKTATGAGTFVGSVAVIS